jgi:hypothetical protein
MKEFRRIERINSDMSSAGTHGHPYGNIVYVKEDVRLGDTTIKINTTGDFNIRVFEWDNGRVGQDIFSVNKRYGPGTYTYSFGGLELRAGKKYWIGRVSTDPNSTDSMDNAYADRSTGMPATSFKYIDTLGGSSFRSPNIDYPSTWYYFYGLEFEAVNMKKASLDPEKNLIPDFYDSRWFDDVTVPPSAVTIYSDNPYGMRMVITTGAQGRLIWIPVETGKTYTFSFGKATGLYRIYRRKVNNHDNLMNLVQNGSPGTPEKFSFTVDESYNGFITIRLTHGSASTLYYENLQLEEGTATQFEKMSLTKLKPAILYPKKNLFDGVIEPGSFDSFGAIGVNNVNVRGIQFMPVKGGTQYTFSVKDKTNITPRVYWYTVDKVFISSALGASQPAPANAAFARWHSGSMTVDDRVQFEEGSSATEYKPYELGFKQ